MTLDRQTVIDRLRSVKGPDLEGDIVSLGLVSEIFIADGKVFFSITVPAKRRRNWNRCVRRLRTPSNRCPASRAQWLL